MMAAEFANHTPHTTQPRTTHHPPQTPRGGEAGGGSGAETCAERSFGKSFSPHMFRPVRQLAHVRSRNLREMATCGAATAETCAKEPTRQTLRGEKLLKKLLSAHVSLQNMRGEKLFRKLLSAQVSAQCATSHTFPAETCARWPLGGPLQLKLARNSQLGNHCAERSL